MKCVYFFFHLRLASSLLCKGHCDKTKTHLGKGKRSVLARLPFPVWLPLVTGLVVRTFFSPVVLSLKEADGQNEHSHSVSTGEGLSS